MRNKSNILADYILENDFDIFCIAETWLHDTDTQALVHLVPAGYVIIRQDRKGQHCGGGLAVVMRSTIAQGGSFL